jgi:hypothetical protein
MKVGRLKLMGHCFTAICINIPSSAEMLDDNVIWTFPELGCKYLTAAITLF